MSTSKTTLQQCTACRGFVPGDLNACPHCNAKVVVANVGVAATARDVARRLRLGALGGAIGGGAIAFTLMACYGAAPCPDGSRECYKTPPQNSTETPETHPPTVGGGDAGAPDGAK